jgi:hypothetical protein
MSSSCDISSFSTGAISSLLNQYKPSISSYVNVINSFPEKIEVNYIQSTIGSTLSTIVAPDIKSISSFVTYKLKNTTNLITKFEKSLLLTDVSENTLFTVKNNITVPEFLPSKSKSIDLGFPALTNRREEMYVKLEIYRNKVKFLQAQHTLLNNYFKLMLSSLSQKYREQFLESINLELNEDGENDEDENENENESAEENENENNEEDDEEANPVRILLLKNSIQKIAEETNFYQTILRNGKLS